MKNVAYSTEHVVSTQRNKKRFLEQRFTRRVAISLTAKSYTSPSFSSQGRLPTQNVRSPSRTQRDTLSCCLGPPATLQQTAPTAGSLKKTGSLSDAEKHSMIKLARRVLWCQHVFEISPHHDHQPSNPKNTSFSSRCRRRTAAAATV